MTEQTFVHPFREALGPPVIAATPMKFRSEYLNYIMSRQISKIGAGWFLGRMFYLLGEHLERLEPCVRAWSFLLPPSLTEWAIIGFNVYGQILLLDQQGEKGTLSPAGMLDPLTVSYVSSPELDVISLLGHWLPQRKLSGFLDTSVYEQFLSTSRRLLEDDEILGIEQALPLGGEMALENFEAIDIVDYYEVTAPVYAKAYAELGGSQTRTR
jgi:hypothetical protein